jgi:hypothetical protein
MGWQMLPAGIGASLDTTDKSLNATLGAVG